MTTDEIHAALIAPFPEADIEFRIANADKGSKGIWCTVFAYVTNRAIQDRLDRVFGTFGWTNSFEFVNNGWLCTISVRAPDESEWISKQDGADPTAVESFKGGLSDAMKRAACQLGIGRYLYKLPTMFGTVTTYENAKRNHGKMGKTKSKETFWWLPPAMPLWALPQDNTTPQNYSSPAAPTPEPEVEEKPSILETAVRCFSDPTIPPNMEPFDYYQAVLTRMKQRVKDGSLSKEDYEFIMNDHYWPTMKEKFPDWYTTEKQAQETFG